MKSYTIVDPSPKTRDSSVQGVPSPSNYSTIWWYFVVWILNGFHLEIIFIY